MKLVASMIVSEVEPGRYLQPCVAALLEFCDEVVMLLDGDGEWAKPLIALAPWGSDGRRVVAVRELDGVDFFAHEGRARQKLYKATLRRSPTHVLAIDADEFVGDGGAIREALDLYPDTDVWSLGLDEVWKAEQDCLCVRVDGGWGRRRVTNLYRTPPGAEGWKILDRALACGREPQEVIKKGPGAGRISTEVLHFGWTNEAERIARHARYVEHDNGQFHARRHLDSILWPNDRVQIEGVTWPPSLLPYREEILERTRSVLT